MGSSSFGTALRSLREELGVSLRRLAAEATIDPAHLSRLETGKTSAPERKTVERLVGALCGHPSVDEDRCRRMERVLLERAGLQRPQSAILEDLERRFAEHLRRVGHLDEASIQSALEQVSLQDMRDVLSGTEPLEIRNVFDVSPKEIDERRSRGESIHVLTEGVTAEALQSIEEPSEATPPVAAKTEPQRAAADARDPSALEYLETHSEAFEHDTAKGRPGFRRDSNRARRESRRADSSGFQRLIESRLDQISLRLDSLDHAPARNDPRLERRLDQLEGRLHGLADIGERVDAVQAAARASFEHASSRNDPQVEQHLERIERTLHDLADFGKRDRTQIAKIEQRLRELADIGERADAAQAAARAAAEAANLAATIPAGRHANIVVEGTLTAEQREGLDAIATTIESLLRQED